MASAITDVTTVPKMGSKAPYSSVTGFHSELVRNPTPNSLKAGALPIASEIMMLARMARTATAKLRDVTRKTVSCLFSHVALAGRLDLLRMFMIIVLRSAGSQ